MSLLPHRQPPARSPLPARALARAIVDARGGERVRATLRETLERRYGAERALLCASGTHALTLALRACRAAAQDKLVLLPAYTCFEVATAAVGASVPVALYDLDAETLEPDWASVREAGRGGAAALVVAPLYGMIVDWDAARSAANELGALLVEDAAQAHGSTWRGRPVGSAGDLSVLSFGRGKGWTGSGGGALLARGRAAALLRDVEPDEAAGAGGGASRIVAAAAQWLLARPALYALPAGIPALKLGETIYHEPTAPQGMTGFSAALAVATDEASLAEAHLRRAHAGAFHERISTSAPERLCGRMRHPAGEAGALRFPVRVTGGWQQTRDTEAARLGAGPPYPSTLAALPALRTVLRNRGSFPVAEMLVRELITLPTHASVSAAERTRLVESILRRSGPVAPAQQQRVVAGSGAIDLTPSVPTR